MTNKNNRYSLIVLVLLFVSSGIVAQKTIVDQIVAVVGKNIIMQSEVEANFKEAQSVNEEGVEITRCKIVEELLYQKLLVAQGQKDSLVISDSQVEQELDRRLSYYIQQFGSEEKLVAFYDKSIDEFKTDLSDDIRDLLLAQQMQGSVTSEITATPSEVKEYFNTIPKDSIPFISMEVEVGHIVKEPSPSKAEKLLAKEKIEGLRQRIMKGESTFATLAALYSEDPGSAKKGGLYEGIQRGQFVPAWEAWAFKLKPNEISEVFESVYGFFIVQLIERRGNEVDARSLLISPKVDALAMLKAKQSLDTIYTDLVADSISFVDAAEKYSDEGTTKYNGGLMVNPFSGTTRFQMEQLGQVDQNVAFAIEKLKVGEFTKPMPMLTSNGKQAYHVVTLKSKKEPHRANLIDDYQLIQATTVADKKQEEIKKWIGRKVDDVYVHIIDDYKSCVFTNTWIK